MTGSKLTTLLLAGGSVLALNATTALAQTATTAAAEEANENMIIVTATRRAENIQDVPMAISAVSGELLEKQGINNINELQRIVPGLRFVTVNTPRNSGVFMRGIGQNGTNPGIEPSVGVFLDGVYLPIPGPLQSNLRDIGSIEVLRGPQGTLYGRNTPAGAININTRAPTQEPEAQVIASYGNFNDIRVSGYVGGGLAKNLALRVSGWFSDRDGYETNLATGEDINKDTQYGVRARLKWDPTETLTINLIGYYTNIKSLCCSPEQLDFDTLATPGFVAGSAALGTPLLNRVAGDRLVEEAFSGRSLMKMAGGSLNIDADLGGLGTLTSITAYSWISDDTRQAGFAGLQRKTLLEAGTLMSRKVWTQELRLASPTDQAVTYVAGLYYLNEDVSDNPVLAMGPGADRTIPLSAQGPFLKFTVGDRYDAFFTQNAESFAAFGQLKFNVTDRFHLIGGIRYTSDKKNADSQVITPATNSLLFRLLINGGSSKPNLRRSEDYITYAATAQYDFTDNVMGYVSYGTGFKSGGFNGSPLSQTTPIEFNRETSDTIEAGLKSSFWDGRVILNFDVYRMNLKGVQTAVVNPNGAGFIVGNAGDRRSQGFELDMVFHPIDELTLRGSLAYLDATYTDFSAGQCPTLNPNIPAGSKPGTCNFTGRRPFHSPPITASLAADLRLPLGQGDVVAVLGSDVTFTDKANLIETLDPRGVQQGYALVGARAGIEAADGRWRVTAFGRNLTNQTYYTASTVLILNAVMSAGGFSAPGGFVGWYAPPRTYGLEAAFRF